MRILKGLTIILLAFIATNTSAKVEDAFIGTWQIGEKGESKFELQVNPDYSAETTRIMREGDYTTEKGYWRIQGEEMFIQFNSGWVIILNENTNSCIISEPGANLEKREGFSLPVKQLNKTHIWPVIAEGKFVGYWKLIDEKGEVFYLNTREDHEAQSTYADGVNGVFGEIGIWRHERNRILVTYNSGWVDIITYTEEGFKKVGYSPEQRLFTWSNNASEAEKIEELPIGRD